MTLEERVEKLEAMMNATQTGTISLGLDLFRVQNIESELNSELFQNNLCNQRGTILVKGKITASDK